MALAPTALSAASRKPKAQFTVVAAAIASIIAAIGGIGATYEKHVESVTQQAEHVQIARLQAEAALEIEKVKMHDRVCVNIVEYMEDDKPNLTLPPEQMRQIVRAIPEILESCAQNGNHLRTPLISEN